MSVPSRPSVVRRRPTGAPRVSRDAVIERRRQRDFVSTPQAQRSIPLATPCRRVAGHELRDAREEVAHGRGTLRKIAHALRERTRAPHVPVGAAARRLVPARGREVELAQVPRAQRPAFGDRRGGQGLVEIDQEGSGGLPRPQDLVRRRVSLRTMEEKTGVEPEFLAELEDRPRLRGRPPFLEADTPGGRPREPETAYPRDREITHRAPCRIEPDKGEIAEGRLLAHDELVRVEGVANDRGQALLLLGGEHLSGRGERRTKRAVVGHHVAGRVGEGRVSLGEGANDREGRSRERSGSVLRDRSEAAGCLLRNREEHAIRVKEVLLFAKHGQELRARWRLLEDGRVAPRCRGRRDRGGRAFASGGPAGRAARRNGQGPKQAGSARHPRASDTVSQAFLA
jgi:hypothetical protein